MAKTHGMRNSIEYAVWRGMRIRCSDPRNKSYKHYGERGIGVCESWQKFENFYADIGPRPSLDHTLDRIDNDKGYEPGNCRWATSHEQRVNVRPRTHCRKGLHEWKPENLVLNGAGTVTCKECHRSRRRVRGW